MHKVRNHPAKTASWDPLRVFELFKVLVSYTVIWRYGKVVVRKRFSYFRVLILVSEGVG